MINYNNEQYIQNKDYINGLNKIKLVIGNGFDLRCGLKSSYKDFFIDCINKNENIGEFIQKLAQIAREYLNFHLSNNKTQWIEYEHFNDITIWDVFFYLISMNSNDNFVNWNWCDIEEQMFISLSEPGNEHNISWSSVFKCACGKIYGNKLSTSSIILGAIAYKKHNERIFKDKKEFYNFLLDQLIIFEKKFGKFIDSQNFDRSNQMYWGITTDINKNYNVNFDNTINLLCDRDKLVSIDSFNYSLVKNENYKDIFYHINGDVLNPIFGIDSNAFETEDPRNIFSKTRRRLSARIEGQQPPKYNNFDNLIIFGHSLNKADYNYFFSLFDTMKIIDRESNKNIIFAYSIFDRSKSKEIKDNLNEKVALLFSNYSKYKNLNEPNRLLDLLLFRDKVKFLEIPS